VARFSVRVTPRARADLIEGEDAGGVLRIRVSAAPAGGAANASVVRLLARGLDVAPSTVTIVSGARSRTKVVQIDGLDDAELRDRISALR
jgi:uncharacterized protein YggU (UPF0235/DUF167 family)